MDCAVLRRYHNIAKKCEIAWQAQTHTHLLHTSPPFCHPCACTLLPAVFRDKGFTNVMLLSADGALEAAPAMGSADIILDLVCPHAPCQSTQPGSALPAVKQRSPLCAGVHGCDVA